MTTNISTSDDRNAMVVRIHSSSLIIFKRMKTYNPFNEEHSAFNPFHKQVEEVKSRPALFKAFRKAELMKNIKDAADAIIVQEIKKRQIMVLTEKEKKRMERNAHLAKLFRELKEAGNTNNRAIMEVSRQSGIDRTWLYRIFKKMEVI